MRLGVSSKSRGFISYSLWGALVTVLVAAGAPSLCKLLKLRETADDETALAMGLALLPDLALAAGTALAGIVCFRFLERFRFGGLAVHLALLPWMIAVGSLAVIEHISWKSTGTLIDWNILSYTLRHFRELSAAVGEEAGWSNWTLVGLGGAAGVLPLAVDLLLRRSSWSRPAGLPVWATSLALVVAGVLVVIFPVSSAVRPLLASAPGGLVWGAVSEGLGLTEGEPGLGEGGIGPGLPAHNLEERIMARADVAWRNPPADPPNILILIMESTRADATSVYNPDLETTPFLEHLAANGAVVERAYAEVPHTSKALVSILCGYAPRITYEIYESENGGLPSPCMAHYLRKLGYRTAFFQAATGTFENRRQLVDNMGYETFYDRQSFDLEGFEKTNYLGVEDKVVTEPALAWMGARDDRPFFATILTIISHHGYGLPSDFVMQRLAPTSKPPQFNRYLNSLRYTDEFLQALVEGLESRDLLDNTIVVVLGDHGQGFKEHGRKYHNDVIYEEGLHVPLVLYFPERIPARMSIPGLRLQKDILPTLFDLLGVAYDEATLEGASLLAGPGHQRIYSSCWYKDRCVAEFDGAIKTIDHFDEQDMELFDLEADPGEKHNLLAQTEGDEQRRWQAHAAAARQRMRDWREEIAASFRSAEDALRPQYLLAEAPVPQYRVRARFGDVVELLGYDLSSHTVESGKSVDLTVYFRCLEPAQEGWRIFGHLQTEDRRLKKLDHDPAQGELTLAECPADAIVADRQRIWIPNNYPPGRLEYYWGIYKGETRKTVRALSPNLTAVKNRLLLLELESTGPSSPELARLLEESVSDQPFPVDVPLGIKLGDAVVVEGFSLSPDVVRKRASVTLSVVYRVLRPLDGAWRLFLHVETADGKMHRQDHSPVSGLHPVARWEPGTWVRDTHTIFVHPKWRMGRTNVFGGLFKGKERLPVTDPGQADVDDGGRISFGSFRVR